jgi:hypothetical protein
VTRLVPEHLGAGRRISNDLVREGVTPESNLTDLSVYKSPLPAYSLRYRNAPPDPQHQ